MQCYKHPKVETALRCGRCERPICTKCSIPGPAGMRCPECASLRSSHLYQVKPHRLVLAAVLGLIVGTIGAAILCEAGFFMLILGPAYGYIVAEVVLKASGRKVGRAIEIIGVGSIIVGALIVLGLPSLILFLSAAHAPAAIAQYLPGIGVGILWPLVGIGLAVSACYSKLRYF